MRIATIILSIFLLGCHRSADNNTPGSRHHCSVRPWIIAGESELCTICNMELVPIPVGEDAASRTVHHGIATVALGIVTNRTIKRTIRVADRIVEPEDHRRTVSADSAGRVDRLYVSQNGSIMKQGDRIYEFYNPALNQTMDECRLLHRRD